MSETVFVICNKGKVCNGKNVQGTDIPCPHAEPHYVGVDTEKLTIVSCDRGCGPWDDFCCNSACV